MRALAYLNEIVATRIDGRSIALTRIIIGIAAVLQMIDSAVILSHVLDDEMMQVPYWDWLPAISTGWLPAYLLLWCLAATVFAIGWHTSIAGIILCLVLGYSLVIDQQSYSNHVYLLILVVALLTLARSGNRLSADQWLKKTEATVPGWPVMLLKIQMSIVYFFAAIAKINLLYISGAVISVNMSNGWIVALPESLRRWEIMMPLAMASIFTEIFLALAFWSPRYRYPATLIGVAFHIMIALAFPVESALALTIFGLIMFAMYIQFLDLTEVKTRLSRPYRPPLESPSTVR